MDNDVESPIMRFPTMWQRAKYQMFNRGTILGILAALTSFSGAVAAAPLLYEPIIFEGNGNAYVLIDTKRQPDGSYKNKPDLRWLAAESVARNATYKGVAGRLAIIDSAALDMFIRTNLRPNRLAWFGVQYICDQQRWVYSNDETIPVNAYTNWHPTSWGAPVLGNTLDCGMYPYLAGYLKSDESGGLYWGLNTSSKAYGQYIVEFPLGEIESAAEATDESTQ